MNVHTIPKANSSTNSSISKVEKKQFLIPSSPTYSFITIVHSLDTAKSIWKKALTYKGNCYLLRNCSHKSIVKGGWTFCESFRIFFVGVCVRMCWTQVFIYTIHFGFIQLWQYWNFYFNADRFPNVCQSVVTVE